jgi:hypothetical protein
LTERLAMRSTIARRLEIAIGSFEKRHGRIRSVKRFGQTIFGYRIKDTPRIKKINLWDVLDLLDSDMEIDWLGIRAQDDYGEERTKAS